MLWYIGRRLLQMIPVFLGATLIVYLLAFYTSGDPILTLAGDKPISRRSSSGCASSTTSTSLSSCSGCSTSRAC